VTESQREAFDDLKRSAWDVGYAYGREGTDTPAMLESLGAEIGGAPPPWLVPSIMAGHAAGAADREQETGEYPAAMARDDTIPF
jgi:hypothetical protein